MKLSIRGSAILRPLRELIVGVLILIGIAAVLFSGGFRPVEDLASGVRFDLAGRRPSQGLTIVEIDSRSLRAAGSWPWDRTRYAEVVENLVDAGAVLVAFDVDFSAPSTPEADGAFAEAISRHPGQVALANFVQNESYGSRQGDLVRNTPLAAFRKDALLASVNVPVDSDGKVRSYDAAPVSSERLSVAALLAGGATDAGAFDIDFGIDHRGISHLSFEDVARNRFDRSQVSERVILIGATALELGDEFATPSGLMPGVYIHGLAYESLTGGRALKTLHPLLILGLCAGLALFLRPRRYGSEPVRALIVRHALVVGALLIVPVVVQMAAPVSLPVAPFLCVQLAFAIWATRVELAGRARAIVQEREAGLLHLAMHQPETELPNRRALLRDIGDIWEARPSSSVSVIAVGVARHAEMRGVVGYNVANGLMVQLARRVEDLTGASRVTQISTSVLAVAFENVDEDDLSALLSRMRELETTFQVEGNSIDIFARIGVAREAAGPVSPELIVERATVALNLARESDDHIVLYDEAAFGSPANNLALMSEMHRALASGDIALHYQPKMTAADGRVRSVEALCRWRHPSRGPIAPDLFIPIAEETGQIRALTEWSIEQAIRDHGRLRAWGHDLTIALNVSGRLLTDEAFRTRALQLIAEHDASLCFEITETAVIRQPALATEAIAAYRAAGIKISIDDYGSGLSSLGYLKMLKADELKIDKSLVVDVLKSQRDRLIMKSTIDLAHGLGMSVVAEGVETDALTACLTLLGCDVIQGYWVARPLPVLQLAEFMDARNAAETTTHNGLEPTKVVAV